MNLLLDRDGILAFPGGLRGVEIRCRGGAVWITRARDGKDHVLRAGDVLQLTRRGRVVIWASAPSLLHFRGAGRVDTIPVAVAGRHRPPGWRFAAVGRLLAGQGRFAFRDGPAGAGAGR